ncbi:hypothetical protein TUA1478L_27510 [Lactiplantibacillus plantarum]
MKENPDVEVKLVPELLTEDNVDLAKGFDGADVYQQKDYTAEVLNKLADEGLRTSLFVTLVLITWTFLLLKHVA